MAGLMPIICCGLTLRVNAASSLAAWALGSDGVLQLRTSVDTRLKAFFISSNAQKGSRVWIDFPGEPVRQRSLVGSGPVSEIRIGKPTNGFTRLVIEFKPEVFLEPSMLKLIGTSPDRWKLKFVGLQTRGLRRIGEGDLTAFSSSRWANEKLLQSSYSKNKVLDLPSVSKGKYRVVIDPGHGGPDPGALGIGGVRETDIVLDISLQVARYLESKGVNVNLTRTSEIDLDLPPRVAIANRVRADVFVSIHANASRTAKKSVNGIETFYFSTPRGLRLSQKIQTEVLKASQGSPDRGVRKGRFFVIRRTNMPAALVETGFVTGQLDAPRLKNPSFRRKLAFAIAKGILLYLQEGR